MKNKSFKHKVKILRNSFFTIGIGVVLVAVPVIYLQLKNTQQVKAAWYNDSWLFRKELTIDASKVDDTGSADLANFPFVLSQTFPELADKAKSDFSDVLFTSSDGVTQLDHEIESYNKASGKITAWIKATLDWNNDTKIYMYYGNQNSANQEDPVNVWTGTDYKGVWHLPENPAVSSDCAGGAGSYEICNSTSTTLNHADALTSMTAANQMNGKIDGSIDFDGTDDYVDAGNDTSLDIGISTDFSIMMWVKLAPVADGQISWFMNKISGQATGNGTRGFQLGWRDDCCGDAVQLRYNDGQLACAPNCQINIENSTDIDDDTWHFIAISADRSGSAAFYVDTVNETTVISGRTGSLTTTNPMIVGDSVAPPTSANSDGQIDEVRFIVGTAISTQYILTSYSNQADPIGFFKTVRNEEKRADPVAIWHMDENGGTTTYDNTPDQENLTEVSNFPTWTQADNAYGVTQTFLDFNGSSHKLISTYDEDFNFGTGSFTVSGWFKHSSSLPGSTQYIINRYLTAGWAVYMDTSGYVCFGIDDDATFAAKDDACSTNLADGTWHHFEAVKTTTSKIELYIDGLSVDSDSSLSASTSLSGASPNLYIGTHSANNSTFSGYFTGSLDNFLVYQYARTPIQVKNDYLQQNSNISVQVTTADTVTKPVGWWRLDELYGDSANSSGSDITVDGSLAGATACPPTSGACPTWYKSGKMNGALDFDGGDYVEVNDVPALDFTSGADFSISGWFYRDTTGTNDVIVAKRDGVASGDVGYILYINSSDVLILEVSDGTDEYSLVATSTFTSVGWTHFVAVWDKGSATNSEIYINGVDDDPDDNNDIGTIGNIDTLANARPLRLGANSNATPTDFFDGKLDDIKLFNYALTAAQVKVEYNLGASLSVSTTSSEAANLADGAGTDPIGIWSLDENTGVNTAYDLSGTAYDLTLTSISQGDWVPGKYGSAIDFDGNNDYATATTENGNFSLNSYSISTWLYRQADSADIEAVLDNRDGATDGWSLFIDANDKLSCSYNSTLSVSTTSIALNTWYHAECTSSGALQTLYLNGLQEDSDAISGSISETTDFRIATQSYGTSQKFSGYLDTIKVHNYTRTPGQVAYEYNRGGPTAWWKFDECTGTVVNDSSGHGLTGTITAGNSSGDNDSAGTCASGASGTTNEMWNAGTTGKINGSLDFDDTNDYVSVADHARLDLTNRLSISFWVNTDANEADNVVVSKGASYEVGINADGDIYYWEGTNTNDDGSARILTGTWHHVTITNDETTLTYYVDGEQTATDTVNVTIGADNTTVLYIGHDGVGGNYFDGQIDEVKIFNYVLSATQVKQVFNSGSVRFN